MRLTGALELIGCSLTKQPHQAACLTGATRPLAGCYSTRSCQAVNPSITALLEGKTFNGCADYGLDRATCACRPTVYTVARRHSNLGPGHLALILTLTLTRTLTLTLTLTLTPTLTLTLTANLRRSADSVFASRPVSRAPTARGPSIRAACGCPTAR